MCIIFLRGRMFGLNTFPSRISFHIKPTLQNVQSQGKSFLKKELDFFIRSSWESAYTSTMETKTIESETALVEYLGAALYTATLAAMCDGIAGYSAPRTAPFRSVRDS